MAIMGQACHGVRNNATDTLMCLLKNNPGAAQPGTYNNPPTSIPGLLYDLRFLVWFGFCRSFKGTLCNGLLSSRNWGIGARTGENAGRAPGDT